MEVVYGARRDRTGDANEYLVVGGECVLGRTWDLRPRVVADTGLIAKKKQFGR